MSTVLLFRGQPPAAEVDLQRREDAVRQRQGLVPARPPLEPILPFRTVLDMGVRRLVLGDGRLPYRLITVVLAVVVADEELRLGWQRQESLDRVPERLGIPTGEVGP
jgi:hypothetical protein